MLTEPSRATLGSRKISELVAHGSILGGEVAAPQHVRTAACRDCEQVPGFQIAQVAKLLRTRGEGTMSKPRKGEQKAPVSPTALSGRGPFAESIRPSIHTDNLVFPRVQKR
jgi:hypothetical protein